MTTASPETVQPRRPVTCSSVPGLCIIILVVMVFGASSVVTLCHDYTSCPNLFFFGGGFVSGIERKGDISVSRLNVE